MNYQSTTCQNVRLVLEQILVQARERAIHQVAPDMIRGNVKFQIAIEYLEKMPNGILNTILLPYNLVFTRLLVSYFAKFPKALCLAPRAVLIHQPGIFRFRIEVCHCVGGVREAVYSKGVALCARFQVL